MKKAYLIFFVVLITHSSLFSQVKNYIPIVKPVLYDATKETFENVARKFEQRNYNELAEIFRSFARGGHGSGFVYVDDDGENYIITNRHVVANSEFVNLEFAGKGSTKTLYESCPIIYTDDNIDLAVIKFPNDEKVFDKSFAISSDKQADGKEIWSAGFPGLMGKPMWQFSKGNVTNEEAFIDQLVSTDISYLIQHSASIDPGNSGGPLLVKDENGAEGYSVIGVNTWTITNRQNTFFAIPSKNIPALISNVKRISSLKNKNEELKTSLINEAKIFSAEINSEKPNWQKAINFISYEYVGNKGWDSFIRILNEEDQETLKLIESKFFSYSPIEAMRYSILFRVWKKLYHSNKKSTIEFKGINSSDELLLQKGKNIRTNFIINGSSEEVEWTFEHGHWRISNYNLDKSFSRNESNKEDSNEEELKKRSDDGGVYLGVDVFGSPYTRCFNSTLKDNFNLMGVGGTLSLNFSGRVAIYARANSLSLNNQMKNRPETLTAASVKFLHIGHGIMIYMGRGKLKPYTIIGFNYLKFTEMASNANVSVSKNYERFGFMLGLGLNLKLSKRIGIFSDASFNSDNILPTFIEEFSDGAVNLSNLQTTVGIKFDLRK